MNVLAPQARESTTGSIYLRDALDVPSGFEAGKSRMNRAISFAEVAGFLAVDPHAPRSLDGPAYRLTEAGMKTTEADVYITEHDKPQRHGVSGAMAIFAYMGVCAFTDVMPTIEQGALQYAIPTGIAVLTGGRVWLEQLAAGREAFAYYNQ